MKKRIVILEDDTDIREMIELILDMEDIEVRSYGRAAEFLKSDHAGASLFLLDVMLPDGNGLEICCKLRDDEKTASIPIVMMSAHLKSAAGSNCLPMDFIQKPFDINDFLLRVNRHLA